MEEKETTRIRCLSLWNPWATAVILGLKKWETRSEKTLVKGTIGIYATKSFPSMAKILYQNEVMMKRLPISLVFGAVIGTVDILGYTTTEKVISKISDIEKLYGDYSIGRFGWKLSNPKKLKEPFYTRGYQKWFYVDIPNELLKGEK